MMNEWRNGLNFRILPMEAFWVEMEKIEPKSKQNIDLFTQIIIFPSPSSNTIFISTIGPPQLQTKLAPNYPPSRLLAGSHFVLHENHIKM
jgi:hypothetical protein